MLLRITIVDKLKYIKLVNRNLSANNPSAYSRGGIF